MNRPTADLTPVGVLQQYFGYPTFRGGQQEIIDAVLTGGDTLVVMPTGGGKSLCYQIPSLINDGITIVVSPLIALMKDQVDALAARGIGATTINSTLNFKEAQQRLTDLRYGKYQMVYVAPERFESQRFLDMIAQVKVSLFAVDEAHCVSEWGHDFRPSYLRLNEAIEAVGRPPVVALTATATPYVQEDIIKQLELQKLKRFVTGFDRPNLSWSVIEPKDKGSALREMLAQDLEQEGVSIVYCGTRKRVQEIGTSLHAEGMPVTIYHAGLLDEDRRKAQEAFIAGRARVIVATNAFGMGIDKADVRGVYHVDMPGSIEGYYQEGGRAGRDGKPSRCVLLWSYRDRGLQEFFIRNSFPEREAIESIYNALWDSVQAGVGSSFGGVIVPNEQRIIARARVHPASIFGALSILEKSEIIEQVRSDQLAMVRFTATGNEIKRFHTVTRDRVRKQTLLGLLRTIGGGALSRETMFYPRAVAEAAELTVEELEKGLKGLTMARLLVYTPPAARGGVKFLQERLPSNKIPIDEGRIEKERSRAVRRLEAMERYAKTYACRRDFIIEYFGGEPEEEKCGRCDNCKSGRSKGSAPIVGAARGDSSRTVATVGELPEDEAKIMRNVLAAVAELGERFGKMTVVDFLIGNPNRTINRFGLDTHPRYGTLSGEERGRVTRIADQGLGRGFLQQTAGMKPVVKITAAGRSEIEGIGLQQFRTARSETTHVAHPELMTRLRNERDTIASRDGFTREEVCPDGVLPRIASRVPTNRTELLRTKGYTQGNFDLCGTSFLGILEEYRVEIEKDDASLTLPIRLRPTYELYAQGYDLEEICRQTARQPSTVSGHLEDLIELGMVDNVDRFITTGIIKNVAEVLESTPRASIRQLKALTGGGIGYPELRIAAAWVRKEGEE